jgi:hypothetical protein
LKSKLVLIVFVFASSFLFAQGEIIKKMKVIDLDISMCITFEGLTYRNSANPNSTVSTIANKPQWLKDILAGSGIDQAKAFSTAYSKLSNGIFFDAFSEYSSRLLPLAAKNYNDGITWGEQSALLYVRTALFIETAQILCNLFLMASQDREEIESFGKNIERIKILANKSWRSDSVSEGDEASIIEVLKEILSKEKEN